MAKRTPAVFFFFCVSLHFFCTAHRTVDVQEEVLAICKISILIFALLLICEISVQFLHWNDNFYTARKTVFCSVKIALLWLFLAASWHWNCETKQCKTERMFWVVRSVQVVMGSKSVSAQCLGVTQECPFTRCSGSLIHQNVPNPPVLANEVV